MPNVALDYRILTAMMLPKTILKLSDGIAEPPIKVMLMLNSI